MLRSMWPLAACVLSLVWILQGVDHTACAWADDTPLVAVEALKTLLADSEIGIGTDESFQAYKKKAGLVAETVAPGNLRTLLQSDGFSFRNTRGGIIQQENSIVLTWWSEADAEGMGDVEEVAKRVRTQMRELGFEETEEPETRFARGESRLLRLRAKELLTFQKVGGACWQWAVVAVVDRNARAGSKVGIGVQWIAAAPPADGSLTLKAALPLIPMWQCPAADAPVLESVTAVPFREFETSLQADKETPSEPSPWSRRGWKFEASGDIRPVLTKGLSRAGYTDSPEKGLASEGSDIQSWKRPESREHLTVIAQLRPGSESTRLTAVILPPVVPRGPAVLEKSPLATASLPSERAIPALLKVADVGTDEAFDNWKRAGNFTQDAVAPIAMRTLITRPEFRFEWLDFGIGHDASLLSLRWQCETECDGDLSTTASLVREQLEKSGFTRVTEELKSTLLGEDLSRLSGRARELLVYRKVSPQTQELVVIPIVDRQRPTDSPLRLAVKWYLLANVASPVTLKKAFEQCPSLRQADVDPAFVDVFDRAPHKLWERSFDAEARRVRASMRILFRGEAWHFQTSEDIRPGLNEALATAGYAQSPGNGLPLVGAEMTQWQRDQVSIQISFMAASAERNEPNPLLSVRFRKTPTRR